MLLNQENKNYFLKKNMLKIIISICIIIIIGLIIFFTFNKYESPRIIDSSKTGNITENSLYILDETKPNK